MEGWRLKIPDMDFEHRFGSVVSAEDQQVCEALRRAIEFRQIATTHNRSSLDWRSWDNLGQTHCWNSLGRKVA
jgi:hypothetical protein